MKVQRTAEAAIWAMPAVSVYDIELSIQRDLGGNFGDITYFSKPMTSRHGILAANDVTLNKHQVFGVGPELTFTLLRKGEPVGFANMRYLVDFGAESMTEGDTFTLALTIPFGG